MFARQQEKTQEEIAAREKEVQQHTQEREGKELARVSKRRFDLLGLNLLGC